MLVDPADGAVRYVGWTSMKPSARYKAHLADKQHTHKACWIRKIKSHGLKPIMRVFQILPVELGPVAECYWISYFTAAGCDLTNHTSGGEGMCGYTPSEMTRQKMSKAHTGRKASEETKKLLVIARNSRSEEQIKRNRETTIAANKTRIWTDEARAKLSSYRKAHPASEETKTKLSEAGKGRKLTDEEKTKISDKAKARWSDPEWRAWRLGKR